MINQYKPCKCHGAVRPGVSCLQDPDSLIQYKASIYTTVHTHSTDLSILDILDFRE